MFDRQFLVWSQITSHFDNLKIRNGEFVTKWELIGTRLAPRWLDSLGFSSHPTVSYWLSANFLCILGIFLMRLTPVVAVHNWVQLLDVGHCNLSFCFFCLCKITITEMQKTVNLVNQFVLFFPNLCLFLAMSMFQYV